MIACGVSKGFLHFSRNDTFLNAFVLLSGYGIMHLNGFTEDDPCGENMAPHIVSAAFRGVRSEVLLHALEADGIYVSAGSACSARKPQPSATLKAMGAEKAVLESTIRFSMSVFT